MQAKPTRHWFPAIYVSNDKTVTNSMASRKVPYSIKERSFAWLPMSAGDVELSCSYKVPAVCSPKD